MVMNRNSNPDAPFGGIGAIGGRRKAPAPIGLVAPTAKKRTPIGAVSAAPKRKAQPKRAIGAGPAMARRPVGNVATPKKKSSKTGTSSKVAPKRSNSISDNTADPRIMTAARQIDDNPGSQLVDPSSEAPKQPEIKSLDDWYMQDSSYLAEKAALDAARDEALAGIGRDRGRNTQDFGSSLKNLGRRWEDENNNGIIDDDELTSSTWDRDNMQGAYGQAFKNVQDDFQGRGLMDSTFFADELTNMDTSFDSQFGDMNTARQNALAELLASEESAKSQYNTGLNQSRTNSAQRRALEYGL